MAQRTIGAGLVPATLVAGLAAAAAWPAAAEGPYVSVRAGAAWLEDAELASTGSIDAREASHRVGPFVSGALGYTVAELPVANLRLRPELELTYRRNGFDDARGRITFGGAGVQTFDAAGRVETLAGFANLWLAYRVPGTQVAPYLGGGVGPARISVDDFDSPNAAIADDTDTVLAYQLGAGAAYAVTGTIDLSLGYRYHTGGDPEMETARGGDFTTEVAGHTLTLGVRYSF